MQPEMQPYKMASTAVQKQPFKIIEIPLSKFTEEVIPHHENAYDTYKNQMYKLINVNDQMQISKELNEKSRVKKQLKDLMYELDTLRTQVEDVDLDKFDVKTLSLRKTLLKLIAGYTEIEKAAERILFPLGKQLDQEDLGHHSKENPFLDAKQLQLEASIDSLKLQQAENTLSEVQNLNQDVRDLHDMYQQLNSMIEDQSTNVSYVEDTVESSATNIMAGTSFLEKASKFKSVTYPVTGAFLGTIIGGPIGLLAGLKVGGAAALGCALAGYTGGHYLKKTSTTDTIHHDTVSNENIENEQSQENIEKKDI